MMKILRTVASRVEKVRGAGSSNFQTTDTANFQSRILTDVCELLTEKIMYAHKCLILLLDFHTINIFLVSNERKFLTRRRFSHNFMAAQNFGGLLRSYDATGQEVCHRP